MTPPDLASCYRHRESLKWHPDRVPVDSPDRPTRTYRFQIVNDAYYVLSDHSRRGKYDKSYSKKKAEEEEEEGNATSAGEEPPPSPHERERASRQFGSVFEEMLRDEGLASEEPEGHGHGRRTRPTSRFWSAVGTASGGALGFIVGNLPGAMAGAVAGNRLGAVRDAKGKSVYEVFLDLPQQDRARLLAELANKVFQTALGH